MTRAVRAVAACLLVLTACGGASDDSNTTKEGLNAEVASFDLAIGQPSRVLVGLFSNDQRFLVFGTVKFRFAYLGTKQDNQPGKPGDPVNARFLPVPGVQVPNPAPTEPRWATGAEARGVYAAMATFGREGFYEVEVTAKVDGKERTAKAAMAVNLKHAVPGPGEAALATENHTLASTDVPKAAIDSTATTGEISDPHLHQTTIAAAVAAKRPAVVVFSTPVFCQSRFCGPVTDMVANLARTYADRASFIHVEIWRDFQNQTLNRAAADWLLRSNDLNEPWVFVIGADGKIAARFDNVATEEELVPILRQLPVIGPAT